MPVEFGDSYLLGDRSPQNAFGFALGMNKAIFSKINNLEDTRKISIDDSSEVLGIALTSGMAYLANRGPDQLIQEIGEISWCAINSGLVRTTTSDNMPETAVKFKYKQPVVDKLKNSTAVEFIHQSKIAHLLTHPDFLLTIKNGPIDALGNLVQVFSTIRDFVNYRDKIDGTALVNHRAKAIRSHFLQTVAKKNNYDIVDPSSQEIIRQYPLGLNSLPANALYQGITQQQFINAHLIKSVHL